MYYGYEKPRAPPLSNNITLPYLMGLRQYTAAFASVSQEIALISRALALSNDKYLTNLE
jgi:hypothetical protein